MHRYNMHSVPPNQAASQIMSMCVGSWIDAGASLLPGSPFFFHFSLHPPPPPPIHAGWCIFDWCNHFIFVCEKQLQRQRLLHVRLEQWWWWYRVEAVGWHNAVDGVDDADDEVALRQNWGRVSVGSVLLQPRCWYSHCCCRPQHAYSWFG